MGSSVLEIVVAPLDAGGFVVGTASLSAVERERAARLHHSEDRRRFIVARAMLRELLAARCGLSPDSLQLDCGRHGKPALAGSRWEFSLSRSRGLAAYAFACGRAVGIDIEAIRPIEEADAVAARTFPLREWRTYSALGWRDKVTGFFRGWTRTEALAKALGGGLGLSPRVLEAALEDRWAVYSFEPAPGFAGAVACQCRGVCR
jgi:4'-phosphopantetheinyl transferase